MDEMVKAWVQILYTDEIDDATQAISNEKLWLKGKYYRNTTKCSYGKY